MERKLRTKRFLAIILAFVVVVTSIPEMNLYASETIEQQNINSESVISEDIEKLEEQEEPEEVDEEPEEPENPEEVDEETEEQEEPEEVDEEPENLEELDKIEETETTEDKLQETTENLEQTESLEISTPAKFLLKNIAPQVESHENGLWSFDVYYVNEDDLHNVHETNDFNLKYQMEFHNSRDIAKGEIEIRIPAGLLEDRSGNMILPSQIAVPKGTPDEFTESKVTSFNYYIDDETNELVFFNYKDIMSGSNFAWQVGYQKIDVMQIVDGSTWSLQPVITVRGDYPEGEEEWTSMTPLCGDVDTCVNLTRLTKEAYAAPGKDYTPAIYTEKQLAQFVTTEIPEKFKGEENFSQYKYVVWEIEAAGEATQMWSMSLTDETVVVNEDIKGEIVGFSQKPLEETVLENGTTSYVFVKDSTVRTITKDNASILVVAAYPADKVQQDTVLKNTVELTITPKDGLDEPQLKNAEAQWSYINFFWDPEIEGITEIVKSENKNYKGWLEIYKARSEQGIDTGSFPFRIQSWSRQGHGKTHNTNPDEGRYGERIEGTKVRLTTADDFMYAYDSLTPKKTILTARDYYYTGVDITIKEKGYDPYEDIELEPTEESTFSVYVMYGRDQDGNLISEETARNSLTDKTKWEKIADVPWDQSGVLEYSLTSQQLKREPWRVMVVHETTNFYTECEMDVEVCLRHDSGTLGEMVEGVSDYQEVTLINTSALIAEHTRDDGATWDYYQEDDGTEGSMYELEGLRENSLALYGMRDGRYPDRYNAQAVIGNVGKSAEATKTVKSRNDTQNSVVRLTYTLTAYDGYEVYDGEVVSVLKENGTLSPGRNDVVFYDLLPYGVRFDPSADIKAGRITDFSGSSYKTTSKAWSKNQVSLAKEPEIIENYNQTGRTLVKFYIHYDGADAAVVSNAMWREGWGVEFGAYYEWKDMQYTNPATNLAAFMPEKDDNRALLGGEGDVYFDDGENSDSDYTVPEEYQIFGKDIDGDGNTEEQTVLYAKATNLDDLVIAAESGIEKFVRAESDPYGMYGKSTVISPGERYTYEITVSNIGEDIEDIYVFDRLENAAIDRKIAEPGKFEDDWWYGTFENVSITGLTELNIEPIIYYHAERDKATIPTKDQHPLTVLTEENGWYTSTRWTEIGKNNKDVQAVAVSLSKKTDGTDFVLDAMESVTFHINMIGPEELAEGKTYAYNNPSFYSLCETKGVKETVIGNSVKVRLEKGKTLEVIKKFDGNVPDKVKDNEFTFSAYYDDSDKTPLAYRKYELYKLVDSIWTIQPEVRATDASGIFYLHADEKAVFTNVKTDLLKVEEKSSIRWEIFVNSQDLQAQEKKIITFKNQYQPLLYVQKEVQGYPERLDITAESFKMKLEQSFDDGLTWASAGDVNYYLVDSVSLGVTEPTILQSGITESDGTFMIKGGETVALTPGAAETLWRITEVDLGDAWECVSPTDGTKEVVLPVQGTSVTFVNNYKYKDIYLTKTITHQDAMECAETFSFKITTGEGENEQPLEDATWVLLENDTETGVEGTTNKRGEFAVDPTKVETGSKSWADKVIRIEGVEAGTIFTIVETESGEDYRPINDTVSDRTPIYATSIDVGITNDYLKRPISVTKQLVYNPQGMTTEELAEVQEMTFEMVITVDGKPYANKNYTVTAPGEASSEGSTDGKGHFLIKGGQTVTFEAVDHAGTEFTIHEIPEEDAKYSQIYPLNKEGLPIGIEEVIGVEGSEATIINGEKGILLIGKEYVVAEDDNGNGEKYLDEIKTNTSVRNQEAVTLTLEVFDETSNEWKIWPEETVNVNVLDSLTGKLTSSKVLQSGEPIQIEPWKLLVITDLENTTYRLKENSEDQYKLYNAVDKWKGVTGFIEISQYEPLNNQPIETTMEKMPCAVIYNQIKGINEESRISKWMTIDSDPVTKDAKLVYIVEKYDGQTWNPANKVPYIISTASGEICGEVTETSTDGKIVLYHQGEGKGTPVVSFTEHKVLVNPSEPKNGTYRIRELSEESDSIWGMLQGYIVDGKEAELDATDANGFINNNHLRLVEIEKALEDKSNQQFTFILNQVTKTEGDSLISADQIVSTEAGTGISYQVYDSETNKYISSGVTGKNGEIYLQGDQYAQIAIPHNTLWTVHEKLDTVYELSDLSGTEGMTQKLGNNLMLIGAEYQGTLGTTSINYKDVDNGVYDARTGAFVDLKAKNIEIPEVICRTPDGEKLIVTEIASSAFSLEKTIGSIKLPNTIKKIGSSAFESSSLEEIYMPDSVESIGLWAFSYCRNLSYVRLSENLKTIPQFAFRYCSSLTDIVIPDSVSTIVRDSFYACTMLENVTFGTGVKSIGDNAFYNCDSLGEIRLNEGLETIGEKAFYSSGVKSITIPASVTKIGKSAFESSGLENAIILARAFQGVGERMFYNCRSLENVVIENLSLISKQMFMNCTSLQSVAIPESVSKIGIEAFSNCTSLQRVDIFEGVTDIDNRAFLSCKSLQSIIIPDSVTRLGYEAFRNCISLKSAVISGRFKTAGAKSVGSYAEKQSLTFADCSELETVVFNQGAKMVAPYMFDKCKKLKNVILSDGMVHIYQQGFRYCESLEEITIPKSVTKIEKYVFTACSSLKNIYVEGKSPDNITNEPWGATKATIHWNQ